MATLNNNLDLRSREAQRKSQTTMDRTKRASETLVNDFQGLRETLEKLNSNVDTLKNVEVLQLAGDVAGRKVSTDFRAKAAETRKKSNKDQHESTKFMVEANARSEAGLRSIRDAVIRFHSDFLGESKLQQAERISIAGREQNEAIKKHRTIGMAQMNFLESFGISSVAGLDRNKMYANAEGKEFTHEELLKAWDSIATEKSQERDLSAIRKIFKSAIWKNSDGVNVIDTESSKNDPRLKHMLDTMDLAVRDNPEHMKELLRLTRDGSLSVEESMEKYSELYLKSTPVQQTLISFAEKQQQALDTLVDQGKDDKLAKKEERREASRKLVLVKQGAKTGRGGSRIARKHLEDGASSFGSFYDPGLVEIAGATYGTKKVLDSRKKKKLEKKETQTKKEQEKKKKETQAKKEQVQKKKETQAKKEQEKKKNNNKAKQAKQNNKPINKKVNPSSAAKGAKVAGAKGKFSFASLKKLAFKVAKKIGWGKLATVLATRLPLLGVSATTGPWGIIIAIIGAAWMAADIYNILTELDVDEANIPKADPSLEASSSQKNEVVPVLSTNRRALIQQQRNSRQATITAEKESAEQNQKPTVVNSGNTTNSGNNVTINNYSGSSSIKPPIDLEVFEAGI